MVKMDEDYADSDGDLGVGYDSSDEEWHDASDLDREKEWWRGVESDSTSDRFERWK